MGILIAGLILFLGIHSVRIVAEQPRQRFIARHGEKAWKGLFSVAALAGLVLIVWGYGLSRADPVFVWNPPTWARHLAGLLTLIAFVLVAAAYVPRNHLQARLGHPMYAGVKIWAFAHFLANGRLGDMLLFGAFLLWSIAGFASARRRDRKAGVHYSAGTAMGTSLSLAAGLVAWSAFAFWLHRLLIGVPPF